MSDIIFVDFFKCKSKGFYDELKALEILSSNIHFVSSPERIPINFTTGQENRLFFVYTPAPSDFADGLYQFIEGYQDDPKCVLCSEKSDTESVRSAFLGGFKDFLKLPFTEKDVRNYISRMLPLDEKEDDLYGSEDSPSELARNNKPANDDLVRALVFSTAEITVRQAFSIRDMISARFKCFAVANAKVVLNVEDYFDEDHEKLTEQYLKILHQHLEDEYLLRSVDFEFIQSVVERRLCLVFFSKGTDRPGFIESVDNFLEAVAESFYARTNYTCLIGLSPCFVDVDRTPDGYLQSVQAIDQQFYSRSFTRSVFRFIPLLTVSEYDEDEYERIISQLSEKKGIESFYEVFEGLLGSFQKKNIDTVYAKKSLMVIFNKLIYNNVSISNSAKNKIFFENNIEKVVSELSNAYEIIKYFAILINDLLFKTYYHKGLSNDIIEKAEAIILGNYEKQITLTSIADELNINPNYLSELFKKHTGLNLTTYITQIRIHKAKVLLSNSDKKIYEIGNDVGYPETVSFTRAFKRTQGISPKEYRKNIISNSSNSEYL